MGAAFLIQLKQFRVGPNVGAVQRNINGNVADDGNPTLVSIPLKLPPLLEKEKLAELPEADLTGTGFPLFLQRRIVPQADAAPPIAAIPESHAVPSAPI